MYNKWCNIKTSSSGTTLIEALVTTVVFTFVSFAVFALFNLGQKNWKFMVLRHSLQADGRRAFSMLETDLRRTHFTTVNDDNRTDRFINPETGAISSNASHYQRGAVCMAGLDNWQEPANYDSASSRPLWNRYILYYASKEANRQGGAGEELGVSGRFFRIVLRPPAGEVGLFSYRFLEDRLNFLDGSSAPTLDERLRNAVLDTAATQIESYKYIGDVNVFSINRDGNLRIVQVTFQTRKKTTVIEGGTRGTNAFETLQLNLNIAPQNSYYLY